MVTFPAKSICALATVGIMVLAPFLVWDQPSQAKTPASFAGPSWWDAGWSCRIPLTVDNTKNPSALNGYQVPFNVSFDADMRPDFTDLRFIQYNASSGQASELAYWAEETVNSSFSSVWVKFGELAGSASTTIFLYFGNSQAAGKSSGPATFDFFDDFEGASLDWAVWEKASTEVADAEISMGGSTLNIQGTGTSMEYLKTKSYTASPASCVRTKMRDYTAASYPCEWGFGYRNYKGSSDGVLKMAFTADQFCILNHAGTSEANSGAGILDDDSTHLWELRWALDKTELFRDGASQGSQASAIPANPVFLSVGHPENVAPATWQGSFDWYLVRKFSSPEPACTPGQKEYAFTFKSASVSPQRPSSGDNVTINATFNNPLTVSVSVPVSFRLGANFNESDEIDSQNAVLAPNSDTVVSTTWTTEGGPQTIWVAAFGRMVGSIQVKVNRNPAIAPVKDQSLLEDRDFLLQVNATDPDGDSLTWSIDNPFFNISPVSNRSAEISVTPSNDDVGVYKVNLTVRDPQNRTDTRRVNFTVINVNDPPVLTKIPSLAATQYKELRYKASASDPDIQWGDILTYSENTDLFEIDARTGEFFFTPVEEQVGKHNVKVTVTDTTGAYETSSFIITVANVNDPPALEFLPPQFVTQGRQFQLKMAAQDPDLKSDPTEKLAFSDDSPLFTINSDSGLISFTPTNDQIGMWMANITVTDKGGLSNTTLLTITVINANDPPSIETLPAQTATEDAPFSIQVNASDPDMKWGLDNLTFSDDTDIFIIDPKTGAAAFTPTGAHVGIKRVTITVKDDKGASASTSFDITIIHVNHHPYDVAIRYPADGAKLKEGDAMWLDGTAKDPDKGDVLQYSWSDNGAPAGTGRNISVKLKPGRHTITLEVSDGTAMVSKEITVNVEKRSTGAAATSGSSPIPSATAGAAMAAAAAAAAIITIRQRPKR